MYKIWKNPITYLKQIFEVTNVNEKDNEIIIDLVCLKCFGVRII